MGDHRARHGALNATEATRNWPLVVRRAKAGDRDAVLAFATTTWDGWDYMPHAWPVWLTADDGALLVATIGPTTDGRPPVDANGEALAEGQPIAVSRVALLSAAEGWVEGIRVDPRVRGMGVATDLQVAELHWLAVHHPAVTRYATSARNEGSHRLGARHGFDLLARFVSWTWKNPAKPDEDGRDEATGFDEATRQDGNRRRQALLERLARNGLIASATDAGALWARLVEDRGFVDGGGLYERRSWTMQALGEAAFRRHVDLGEVVALSDSGWGVAIISREAEPAEDAGIHLSVIAGDTAGLAKLAYRVQAAAGEPIRFRLEANSFRDDLAGALRAAGFQAWQWELHILGRSGPASAPPVDPARLILSERPQAVIRPPA
jgi:acetyltransferase (GNAT) family protein